ncbi:beta-lactamase family protein [Chitinophaga oryzae]|uniref:Beta-lactamase family protein n=1 Tax=Chitinophaga oryzae TaxID=2725414 RepID=A0AAE7DAY3_9BACT|nr:serine hydrolase domain-containing protein [Chitinophaga oryzae]QJB35913.1 beta-lactamase family protein [Chitinophaga oryzae]
MKRILILTLLFTFSLITFVTAQEAVNTSDVSRKLDSFLQMATKLSQFNGSVLVSYHGAILLNNGYGFKNVMDKIPNNTQSIFQIGSITKEFTSTVILSLESQDKLSLQDKLSKYFPDFPSGDQISIHHLLTHTSGLYNYTSDIEREDSAVIGRPVDRNLILQRFINQPLAFKPGSAYSYCNSGYFLLGMIIEKVTGTSWEENVRKLILAPLEMSHSGFDFIGLKDTDKATGYQVLDDDRQQVDIVWDSTVSYAAGSMYATTSDILRWSKAIVEKRLLPPASWNAAFAPRLHGYGYGWSVDSLLGERCVGHGGGIPGFSSHMLIFPEKDLEIIVLSNVHENTFVEPVSKILASLVLDKPYIYLEPRAILPVTTNEIQAVVGTYRLDNKHQINILARGEKLYIEAPSNMLPLTRLYKEEENAFFIGNITLNIQSKLKKAKLEKSAD